MSENIQFEVLNNFKPTIESNQTDHRIEYGHAPEDDLTGMWIRPVATGLKATIKSTGTLYYFHEEAGRRSDDRQGWGEGRDRDRHRRQGWRHQSCGRHLHHHGPRLREGPQGSHPSSLPTPAGWYTWVWQITPDMQDAPT